MKKQKKTFFSIFLLSIVLILSFNEKVFAKTTFQKVDYSEDFIKWTQLPDEEKENVMQPRMYNIVNTNIISKSPLYRANMLRSTLNSRFSLKDVIPNNVIIKDQKDTGSCWTFAALSSLETNLALSNYKKGINQSKVYDFSERHMNYATSRVFANNEINELGYNRRADDGGQWYIAHSYLTNGLGAVNEEEMPFENNENIIDINEIKNKVISSQVYDIIEFPNYSLATTNEGKVQIMNQVKQHIQNYGAVFAPLHGDNSSTFSGSCYNNDTAAKYCNFALLHRVDHAISVIGWDDNYSVDNFVENARPKSNGAWIVRNSWGERLEYDLADLKNKIFNIYNDDCKAHGWTNASLISNEYLQQLGYTVENNKAYSKIGDNGLIYVSYEDVNISTSMFGIQKATDTINYDHIYQYDNYYPSQEVTMDSNEIMLCNIFDKKTNGTEYLNQVSLYTIGAYNCKVYVNPNGTGKTKDDLKLVQLKSGESKTTISGYNTFEFANPVELNSDNFVVVIEISGDSDVLMLLESRTDLIDTFDVVQVENNKCFAISKADFEKNGEWYNLGRLSNEGPTLLDGDNTIKAFTTFETSEIIDDSLKSIEIVTPPTKTSYFEGDNFDQTGMVVLAHFNNDTSTTLDSSDYSILNGSNLTFNQNSVTIKYSDKTVEQPITVEKNIVTELKVKTPPAKVDYKEGENFDKTSMVIEAIYKNGSTKTISDYTIVNGNNLKIDQKQVTISYEGKTVLQPISVTANALTEINVQKAPNKIKYVIGQNFDKTGMVVIGTFQDGSTQEILNYTIENGTDLKKDQSSVTIKYQEKSTSQSILVEDKTITSIIIIKNPLKLTYIKGKEILDLTGGSLKITYNDGYTENIDLTSKDLTVSGFNNNNLGKSKITVTYQSFSTQFEIEIVEDKNDDAKEEERAENSDLSKLNCDVKKVQAYYFTNNSKNDYLLINAEINSISRNLNNDKVDYYYYLSPNANEQNINNWIKISESQSLNDKLQFLIDSRKISNFDEISNEQVIYLYVKEVAIKGGNQSVSVSKPMKLEVENNIEVFVDNIKKNNINLSNPGNDSFVDNTTAVGKLPNTGVKISIIISITVIFAIGMFLFVRYKKLSKYIK